MNRRKHKSGPFSKKTALLSSFLVSLILNAILVMGIFLGRSHSYITDTRFASDYVIFFLWHFCFNVLLFFVLFIYNFYIIKKKKSGWVRTIYILTGAILLPAVLSPLLARAQWYVMGGPGESTDAFMLFNLVKDIIASVIILMFTSNIYMAHKREQTLILNQRLREENIRTRYEALKNQLDPHFLFNSLNTLNGLVGIDDDKAHEYIDNLSSVFRYTLHSKTVGTLDKEVEYVNAYLSLLKIRYGDNLRVNYRIAEKYRQYHIMPASLQLLVENVVKHNTISDRMPMMIHIATTDRDSIIVSNRINPKVQKSIGGLGLANLADRYSILFNKNITISDTDGVFAVEVPLIQEIDKKFRI